MPFKARCITMDSDILITDYEFPRVELDGMQIVCPYCEHEMGIRGGIVRRTHFFHKVICDAPIAYKPGTTNGESLEHVEAKRALMQHLQETNTLRDKTDFDYEMRIKERGIYRIADIGRYLIATKQMLTAYEIQLSRITIEQLRERTEAYNSCNVDTIWIFGGEANTPDNKEWCARNNGQYWEVSSYDSISEA